MTVSDAEFIKLRHEMCSRMGGLAVSVPCPCCKASNTSGPQCRRCKADLSLLFAIESQRLRFVAQAREQVRLGRIAEAIATVSACQRLRAHPDALRILALASVVNRNFAAARRAYDDLRRTEPHRVRTDHP